MSESGIDFSYVTPVTEHPHQLGTESREAVLRGPGAVAELQTYKS